MSPRAAGPPAGPEAAGGVHVGRLALRVSGLDEDAARALARLVAERLTADLLRPAGAAGLDSLQVEVRLGDTGQAATPDALAQCIADQVGRVLARDRASGGPDAEAAP
jgi:hypothetical protein